MFAATLGVLLALGCGGDGEEPSLDVFSDSDGVLHVSGSGWSGCARVSVALPNPWGSSESRVGGDGGFSVTFAHPLVKPYEGAVTVTCAQPSRQPQATAQIRVGDPRYQAK